MIDKVMFDLNRSEDQVLLQITTSPRTKQMKLNLYKKLPVILHEKINLRPDDIFVSIITEDKEDWSFGDGKAQLLE